MLYLCDASCTLTGSGSHCSSEGRQEASKEWHQETQVNGPTHEHTPTISVSCHVPNGPPPFLSCVHPTHHSGAHHHPQHPLPSGHLTDRGLHHSHYRGAWRTNYTHSAKSDCVDACVCCLCCKSRSLYLAYQVVWP